VFPFKVNNRWNYREQGFPWKMEKEIVGTETITTPAGIFSCYKIQWFWYINDTEISDTNITGFDYISNQGLIKRLFLFKDFIVTGNDPEPIGYFDMKDESIITSLDIK
jgi:hypothetical protein